MRSTSLVDLQALERKAFRSTQNRGLVEIYLGVLLLLVSLFMTLLDLDVPILPAMGVYLVLVVSTCGVYTYLRKKLASRRVGSARFGERRQRRVRVVHYVMMAGALVLATLVVSTPYILGHPPAFLSGILLLAILVSLQIGVVFIAMAWYLDSPRYLFSGFLVAASVFADLAIRESIHHGMSYLTYGAAGLILILVGAIWMRQFLREHPPVEVEGGTVP